LLGCTARGATSSKQREETGRRRKTEKGGEQKTDSRRAQCFIRWKDVTDFNGKGPGLALGWGRKSGKKGDSKKIGRGRNIWGIRRKDWVKNKEEKHAANEEMGRDFHVEKQRHQK